MPPTPLYNAISILRTAITDALAPLMAAATPPAGVSYLDSAGRVKCYWTQAEQLDANQQPVVLPYLIVQSQDNGGTAAKTVGELAWSGLVTVRALAAHLAYAEALIGVVAPGMASLRAAGYSITVAYERPIVLPPQGGVWQAAHQWRIAISAV
jgi:hypothetical protein